MFAAEELFFPAVAFWCKTGDLLGTTVFDRVD